MEPVYAVWDYYDGIRAGFANFRGAPHYFEALWHESDDVYTPTYQLKRVDEQTIDLVLQHSEIFRAWEAEFHGGNVPESTHPGLPGQNARYAELEDAIHTRLASAKVTERCVVGKFDVLPGQEHLPRGVTREVVVQWSDVETTS